LRFRIYVTSLNIIENNKKNEKKHEKIVNNVNKYGVLLPNHFPSKKPIIKPIKGKKIIKSNTKVVKRYLQ